MFRGYWLVADMDGTLAPTPTKAHGKYFSLSQSAAVFGPRYPSCLPHLRRFVASGGSLCVVSTAGKRLWQQLYADLARTLYPPPQPPSSSFSTSGCTSPDATSPSVSSPPPGQLLLCGFTGAALFRSRDPLLVQQEWRAVSASTAGGQAADDDAAASVPASLGLEEWAAYRQTAAAIPSHSPTTNLPSSSSLPGGSTVLDGNVLSAVMEEGRAAVVRFFEHASYVNGHNLPRARAFFEQCLSRKYHEVYTHILSDILNELHPSSCTAGNGNDNDAAAAVVDTSSVPVLCFDKATALQMEALTTYGRYLRETNDALVDCQAVPGADGVVPPGAPAAQVVVMGIPMRYYAAIFSPSVTENGTRTALPASSLPSPSSSTTLLSPSAAPGSWACCPSCEEKRLGALARLSRLGLEVKSQPNSVCIHRVGIDKATCVRWMLAHREELNFSLDRALSFGDVPESVDLPLATFPPMRFISLSMKEDDGLTSPSASAVARGVKNNVWHVGGEEEGTGLFLEELMRDCVSAHGGGGAEGSEGNWFSEARVAACALRARERLREFERASL